MSQQPSSAEAIEQARQDFEAEISILAHDLAGPLARIVNCLQLMRDLASMGDTATLDQVLEIALTSAQGEMHNIETLQEVTRLSNGLKQPQTRPVELARMVDNALSELGALITEARAHIRTEIPADLPALWADEAFITRALRNLLENALRHIPEGGHILVQAARDGNHALIRVIDNGKGVPDAQKSKIFNRFYRMMSYQMRGKRGIGLGLTYARIAVETHGGKLWVEDAPKGGASFLMRLPIADPLESLKEQP